MACYSPNDLVEEDDVDDWLLQNNEFCHCPDEFTAFLDQ